jgi:hypothetical protein
VEGIRIGLQKQGRYYDIDFSKPPEECIKQSREQIRGKMLEAPGIVAAEWRQGPNYVLLLETAFGSDRANVRRGLRAALRRLEPKAGYLLDVPRF